MKKVGTLCYKHFPKLIPLFVLWRVKLSSSSSLPSWVLFNGELWFQKYYISVQFAAAAAAAKSLQSCPTVCDPIDGSPPGSPVPGQEHWSGLPLPSVYKAVILENSMKYMMKESACWWEAVNAFSNSAESILLEGRERPRSEGRRERKKSSQ